MLRLLNKREKIILYLTIGLIIAVAVFNFLVAPLLARNQMLNGQITASRTKLKKYLHLLRQKNKIQNQYNTVALNFSSRKHSDAAVAVLSDLENIAKSANINILEIRPQTPQSSTLYKEIVIDLRTEGNIEGYVKFIYDVENSLSLLKIKRFQLTTQPATGILEGNFSISQISLTE